MALCEKILLFKTDWVKFCEYMMTFYEEKSFLGACAPALVASMPKPPHSPVLFLEKLDITRALAKKQLEGMQPLKDTGFQFFLRLLQNRTQVNIITQIF